MADVWQVGAAYEAYVGRWSRLVAARFVPWLTIPDGRRWLDVGCGTGALTSAILAHADPDEVVGIDPSEAFLAQAREHVTDPRARFSSGDARALPVPPDYFDAVVSGLAVNFVPEPQAAAAELVRVAARGGVVAAYVWDYAEGMQLMRHFWNAATTLDPGVAGADEGSRFPLCRPGPLAELWWGAGLHGVTVEPIEIPTTFSSFDDYWAPFLGGQGPGPAYAMSLPEERRGALRELLRERLPTGPAGSIELTARAWGVRGVAAG